MNGEDPASGRTGILVRGALSRARGEEARKAITLTGAEGVARLLSFLFYLLAAQVLGLAGFGVVRYTITLAMVAYGLSQFASYAIMRELGASRGDPMETARALRAGVVASGAVLALSLAIAAVAIAAGATPGADSAGLLAVTAGLTVFQLYYSIARGLDAIGHAAWTYVGGSITQLVLFGAVALAADPSPSAALLIFAGSSIAPVIVLELWRPLLRRGELRAAGASYRRLWSIGGALIVGQLGFTIWNSSDQIWVSQTLDAHQSGLYQAAKNLVQILVVPASGVAGIVLPRVAEMRAGGRDLRGLRLITGALFAVTALLAVTSALLIGFRETIFTTLYGDSFGPAGSALWGLAVATTTLGAFIVISHGAIGWGSPRIWSAGYAIAAVANLVYLALFAHDTIGSIAWGEAFSIGVATLVALAWLYRRRSEGAGGD